HQQGLHFCLPLHKPSSIRRPSKARPELAGTLPLDASESTTMFAFSPANPLQIPSQEVGFKVRFDRPESRASPPLYPSDRFTRLRQALAPRSVGGSIDEKCHPDR